MSNSCETSDGRLLDLLRSRGPLNIAEMAEAGGVTATAVRQRLTRLMDQGLVQREAMKKNPGSAGRGRPEHRYSLTEKAVRLSGNNYADLAMALWQEIRAVPDAEVRRGLLQRIADQMTRLYRERSDAATLEDRLKSLQTVFADRRIPIEVSTENAAGFPTLRVVDCPYPELAAQDRGICAMEKMMFQGMLDQPLTLSQCRLDGHACCEFEAKPVAEGAICLTAAAAEGSAACEGSELSDAAIQ